MKKKNGSFSTWKRSVDPLILNGRERIMRSFLKIIGILGVLAVCTIMINCNGGGSGGSSGSSGGDGSPSGGGNAIGGGATRFVQRAIVEEKWPGPSFV